MTGPPASRPARAAVGLAAVAALVAGVGLARELAGVAAAACLLAARREGGALAWMLVALAATLAVCAAAALA